MRRTQIYLTGEEWRALASVSRDRHLPKSALIREAVDQVYISKNTGESFSKALWEVHGIWRDRKDIGDPAPYLRKVRQGGRRNRHLEKQWRRSSSTPTS